MLDEGPGDLAVVRDMATVVAAMFDALTRDDAPPDIAISLWRRLRIVVDKVGFTAPELMGVRWSELTSAFNATVFGTTDEAKWNRSAAPRWAVQAGRILAGEVAI
jgi:hypothetical protein